MNTPSPLVPQGALERQSKGKSTVRIAIFTIVSIHAVFFAGLLMQGCRQDETKTSKNAESSTNQNTLPSLDTTYYPATQDVAQVLTPAPVPAVSTATVAEQPAQSLPSPSITDIAPPEGKTYTILRGDTLARIAAAQGTTVAAIRRLNPGVEPTRLKAGQKIQLPAPSATPSQNFASIEPLKSDSPAALTGTHTVKAGENLTRIARQHGVTVKALRAANNLKSDRVNVGQKLKLPATGDAKISSASKGSSNGRAPATHLAADSR